jgi:hypothetical protein
MNLETRIKTLEQILTPGAPELLVAVFMCGRTPTGWGGAGHILESLPGESETDFRDRALKQLLKLFPGPVECCRALAEILPG